MKVASVSKGEAEVGGVTLLGTDSQIRAMLARLLHAELNIDIARIPKILRAGKSQVYASIRPRAAQAGTPAAPRFLDFDFDGEDDPDRDEIAA